jgi:HD-like signal output (HDOD) protein
MNTIATGPGESGAQQGAGSEFVRELIAALSAGPVELPGFPEVALRVQDLLADEGVSTDTVVRIVGAEAVLAARIVSLANSVAMNPSSTPVIDLRTAVARLGLDSLRAAAVSFAVAQLRRRDEYRDIEPQLAQLWLDSVAMASTACVIARRCRRMSPDTALFAGLIASVGRIYILTRAAAHPKLFVDAGSYQSIVRERHAGIARSLLTSWQVVDEVVDAVHTFETRDQETRPGSALPDVLVTAALLNSLKDSPELLVEKLREARAVTRLGLNAADCTLLLKESAAEMASLRTALGR